jgi:hypothetical protein
MQDRVDGMPRLHLQGDFWKHLETAFGEILQEKEQAHSRNTSQGKGKESQAALLS